MKNPHFFKAKSRIGLTHKPVRQTELNLGVEDGPDAILSQKFLSEFSGVEVSEYTFPTPENIQKKDYWQILASNLKRFKNQINKNLKKDQTQIVIGGENSITFSSLLAVFERVKGSKKIGYIQFDSHGEMNSFGGSISKNFHGMYMRPFFETFDILEIANLVPYRLAPPQALFIGDIVLDGDEPEFFKKMGFRNIKREDYLKNPVQIQTEVKEFISGFNYIHTNFDIDIFHESIAGATGIPEDGKWLKDEVFTLLKIISTHPILSFDLSEVNPKKPQATKTVKLAQQILNAVLS